MKFPIELLDKWFPIPETNPVKINYCRRGMCCAQTVSQELECLNHEPAKGKRYDQICEHRGDDGKCRKGTS